MKKLLTFIFLIGLTTNVLAQKQAVIDAFNKYKIDTNLLKPRQQPENFSYDYKFTSITNEKATVTLAKYDPSKALDERWTVISVKGKAPSPGELKTFRKNHSKQPPLTKIDDKTYLIEKESSDYLVISYKQDPSSLPDEAKFMKDCRQHMTINLKTKRMEKLQSLNEKPLKIKIFNAEKLDLVVKYIWNEQEQLYFTESEDMNLIIKFLGQLAPMETISEYSNYKKM